MRELCIFIVVIIEIEIEIESEKEMSDTIVSFSILYLIE